MKRNLLIFISGTAIIFTAALANSENLTKTQKSESSHSSGSHSSRSYSSGYTTSQPSRTMHSAPMGAHTNEHGMPVPDNGKASTRSKNDTLKPNPMGSNSSNGNRPQ